MMLSPYEYSIRIRAYDMHCGKGKNPLLKLEIVVEHEQTVVGGIPIDLSNGETSAAGQAAAEEAIRIAGRIIIRDAIRQACSPSLNRI